MGTNRKVFAMAMVCVLAMAAVLRASDVAKHRALIVEDKVDGNPNESNKKVASSPSIISPTVGNHAIHQGHTLPPQSEQTPPKSVHSDPAVSVSPPSVNNSEKLVPPLGPQNLNPGTASKVDDKTSHSAPNKEEIKTPEASKEEDSNPVHEKGDHEALQSPILATKAPEAPKKDSVQQQNDGTSKFGNPGENDNKSESCETANASDLTCRTGVLLACLRQAKIESRDLFLIIQNTGDVDLNVNISSPGKIKLVSNSLILPTQSKKKVNLMADTSMDLKIILNAGQGDCVLQTKAPSSDWFYLQQFPAYAAQVRPMHGAYFLFATIIIGGGTWAFCKFGKKVRRVDAGIPYQQLEMAAQQTRSSSVPSHEVAADAWDQSWDDDWDDEEAVVRSSAKQTVENVSSNGPSSRPANPNQCGWEIEWDD